MRNIRIWLAIIGVTMMGGSAFQHQVLGQDASLDFEIELPEEAADFGTDDFAIDTRISEEEATANALFLSIVSAACTGVPALLLGLVIGFFLGKSRRPNVSPASSEA